MNQYKETGAGFITLRNTENYIWGYFLGKDKSNEKTVGKLEICEYFTTSEMKDNDKTSPWNLPYKAGYEWKYLDMDCSFGDNNAQKYGWELDCHCVDYYTIKQFSDSEVEVSDGVFENIVNYNGNDTPIVSKVINIQNSGWINHEEHCYMNIAVQVPVGYDGIVLVFHDTSVEWDDDSFYVHEIYDEGNENALFFRLD